MPVGFGDVFPFVLSNSLPKKNTKIEFRILGITDQPGDNRNP